MRLSRYLFVLSLLIIFASACTTAPAVPTATPLATGYPASSTSGPGGIGAYPAQQAYPTSGLPTRDPDIKPFHLKKPIIEGATVVTGTGPAGVPILLQDVTFTGALLGETVIGQDGTFTFQVKALEAKHRIGVALGNLDATHFKPEDFNNPSYQGDGAMQVPQIGYYYDTTLVQAKPIGYNLVLAS